MAKKNEAAKNEETAVAEKTASAVGAVHDYGTDAGLGFDTLTRADFSIPFLNLLQALSPECGADPAEKVPGAQPGMLLNSVTKELYAGDKGVVFVPCESTRMFVEWKKDRGGLLGMHSPDAEIVKTCRERNGGSVVKMKTSNGDDLVETFYVYGLLLEEANAERSLGYACIAFTSTKIKTYRDTMYRLRSVKGVQAPLFANRLRITTVVEKNPKGTFSNLRLDPAVKSGGGPADDVVSSLIPAKLNDGPHPLLLEGKKLLEMVRGGVAKADFNSQKPTAGAGGGEEETAF